MTTAGEEYVRRADRALEEAYEEPLSLAEYVDRVLERPTLAAGSTKYLLAAIEGPGTRTVFEEGRELERYRFFDDPFNDGEHAVLGNTGTLNDFVDDLRTIAAGRGKEEKIIWFDGPTATGKSELKRCLINGLREFSKTAEGRRYTIEWNVASVDRSPGLTYGDGPSTDEANWFESPVQTHPLSVFPATVRAALIARINEDIDAHEPIRMPGELDPFSREAYDYLEETYRRQGVRHLFTSITDRRHLRVKNYLVDIGKGIGVLHSEDDGTPKERLVGSWMPGMLRELDSRGRKNPQAFSYDGVLSQGNGLLAIVEDATQHADLLQKLLNVPDEGHVKLDKGVGMDVETQLIVISNPDLEAQLNQHADRNTNDPLKALKRRLDKHQIRYLVDLGLECELLRRELTDRTTVRERSGEDRDETVIRGPLTVAVSEGHGSVVERELAPHAVEAAAMYDVVSRLDDDPLPDGLTLVDRALLLDRGRIREGDEILTLDDVEVADDVEDGLYGIPVTFTRDVITELLSKGSGRHHPSLPVERVVLPGDVLEAMIAGMTRAPVFSRAEQAEFEDRLVPVEEYVYERQERDVLAAILHEERVDESSVETYVEHVYAWAMDEPIRTDHGEAEPDPLRMKVFETQRLGRFDDEDYEGKEPGQAVERFRREKVITALNRQAWRHRDEDFSVEDVDLLDVPIIEEVLGTDEWDDVERVFEDFDPDQWDDPPSGTETAEVKRRAIDVLVREFGYSPASAELTSRHVMDTVALDWPPGERR